MSSRLCSKPGCQENAAGTLSYSYAERVAVIGPLSLTPEPHTYDLCETHLNRLNVPAEWKVLSHKDFRKYTPSE